MLKTGTTRCLWDLLLLTVLLCCMTVFEFQPLVVAWWLVSEAEWHHLTGNFFFNLEDSQTGGICLGMTESGKPVKFSVSSAKPRGA